MKVIKCKKSCAIKMLSNFWRTLEMPLINRKINLILTWSVNCVISEVSRVTAFATRDIKLHVSVVTLSTQGNTKITATIAIRIQMHS